MKFVITTSSSEITNASIAPAAMPGVASGSTMRRNALERRGAEIGRGFDEPIVERGEARLDDHDDERDAEHDVRERSRW